MSIFSPFKKGKQVKKVFADKAAGKTRKSSTPAKKATATRSAPAKRTVSTTARANAGRQRLIQRRK